MEFKKSKDYNKATLFLERNFSSPTHWPDWNLVVSSHYNTDFYYYMAYQDEELIGIFPIHEKKNKVVFEKNSGQYYYIPNGGWIFSKKKAFNFKSFKSNYNTKVSINTLPSIDSFNANYENCSELKQTLVISLNQSIEDIWMNEINSKRRNMIRKAEKANVIIKSLDINQIDLFYEHYKVANFKNGIFIQSREFFLDLLKNAKNIKVEILLASIYEEAIGLTVIIYDKNYALYWLGVTIPSENFGQGDLLQWEAIKRAKNYGCKYYDLCYIDEKKLPNIFKFKKGFSTTKVSVSSYTKTTFFFKVINRLLDL